MHNVKVNQVYVAPLMAGRILRRIRILAPHPDGGYLVKVLYNASGTYNDIVRVQKFGLEKTYRLEQDVCEHKNTEDWFENGLGSTPSHYRCIDCGDLFPNTGDTALWFPKVLEVKENV